MLLPYQVAPLTPKYRPARRLIKEVLAILPLGAIQVLRPAVEAFSLLAVLRQVVVQQAQGHPTHPQVVQTPRDSLRVAQARPRPATEVERAQDLQVNLSAIELVPNRQVNHLVPQANLPAARAHLRVAAKATEATLVHDLPEAQAAPEVVEAVGDRVKRVHLQAATQDQLRVQRKVKRLATQPRP